jgi:hypothetical protein
MNTANQERKEDHFVGGRFVGRRTRRMMMGLSYSLNMYNTRIFFFSKALLVISIYLNSIPCGI